MASPARLFSGSGQRLLFHLAPSAALPILHSLSDRYLHVGSRRSDIRSPFQSPAFSVAWPNRPRPEEQTHSRLVISRAADQDPNIAAGTEDRNPQFARKLPEG